ncbi:hypothetical protein NESM_000384200 [Novymonas esmeraldas]|uniref:UBX domain-containing protein n=1 Tax=Novymonas esmeraldas TaxID=1808958 RepID=A0AAW0EKG5_9TRYP
MLHKYEKIDEAMAACVALEYPLIVAVHDALPSFLNNADEAARGGGAHGGGGGGGAQPGAAGPSFSFLPASYSISTMARPSSGFFADASDSCDASHTAPDAAAATVNASLGYMMHPANLSAGAADAAAVAQAVADGEELALAPTFPLGRVQGGAAQREALLVTLLEGRMGSVTLLHLIDAGTPDGAAFASAVPVAPGTTLPRVHVFFPPNASMAPMVLSGNLLTPRNLYNCVQMGLLRHKAPVAAAADAPGLRSFFATTVTAMNRECARARQQTAAVSLSTASAQQPQQQQQRHSDASAGVASAMTMPAQRARGVSQSAAFNAAHMIAVAGLPMSFSTAATTAPVAVRKTILTAPTMTLQTVWRTVEKHLEWAQREVQQAQAASTWNGVTPPKKGAAFSLVIEAPDASAEAAELVVTTNEEAAKVRLQDYPRNTVVHVRFSGAAPPTAAAAAAAAEEYICDGDVCRRKPQESTPTPTAAPPPAASSSAAPAASAPAPTPAAPTPTPTAASATTTAAASVKLHCSLPNGKTVDVAQLDPLTATLRADVRPVIAEALGYDAFVFVCAYPPKRYSVEDDEPRPLAEVGLGRSSALRVVSLNGPTPPDAASGGASAQSGQARQMLTTAASSLMSMFRGAAGNRGGAEAAAAAAAANSAAPRPPPQRRTYNSMAEMLAANEQAERETAMERLRQQQQQQQEQGQPASHHPHEERRGQGKKSNRYFGGGSTELVANDDDDDDVNNSNGGGGGGSDAAEGLTPAQQEAYLREQLQQLMRRHRRPEGEEAEEEAEEAEQRQSVVATGRRVFYGQGQRLAGDAPSPRTAAPPSPGSPADTAAPAPGERPGTQPK